MRFNDAITGVVLVVFAIAVIAYSTTFPSLHGQAYGPSLFPTLIGCCLLACGLLLIVRGLRLHHENRRLAESGDPERAQSLAWVRWGDWVNDGSRRVNMLLLPCLLIVYILFSDLIGFIPLSVFILSVLLLRLGTTVSVALLIAVANTLVLQLLFAKVLLVPLPPGLLLRWIG